MIHAFLKSISYLHLYSCKLIDRGLMYLYRHQFAGCGKKVVFYPTRSDLMYRNIYIGNDVFIGPGASFYALISRITIGDKVAFGPNVTIRGGNHSSHIIGKYLFDYQTRDKRPEDDQPVKIENDV